MSFTRLVRVDTTGSTNTDLMRALDDEAHGGGIPGGSGSARGGAAAPARESWPHLSALVARDQVAGRGRAGSEWHTAPGTALTVSVVLRTELPITWIPLAVGVAVRRALSPWVRAALKWPNDVVADLPSPDPAWGWGPKLAGILCERHASGAVVAGIGINCLQAPEQLPVPWAGSIASVRAAETPTLASAAMANEVRGTGGSRVDEDVMKALAAAGGPVRREPEERMPGGPGADGEPPAAINPATLVEEVLGSLARSLVELFGATPDIGRLRAEYERACTTVGADVRVRMPGGTSVFGSAIGIGPEGELLVRDTSGEVRAVTSGEVRRV